MSKRSVVSQSIALALLMPGAAHAVEITGYIKNETSVFTQSGQTIGAESSNIDTSDTVRTGEVQKFENSARAFINGDIGENASWHADINVIYDTEGVNSYWKGYERFTSYDYLRELYADFNTGPVYWRLGKQQVVWGTADGIKLLDIINPTDFRFFVQDTFEDSRIPVWMAKAEIDVGEAGNIQALISQHRQNIYPGLSPEKLGGRSIEYNNPFAGQPTDNSGLSGVDQGQPFLAQGTDSITGLVNGFYNITPALGGVANTFVLGALAPPLSQPAGLVGFRGLTVQNFVDGGAAGFPCPDGSSGSAACLNFFTQISNQNVTNLMPGNDYDSENPTSAFEYFPNATFATFNSLANADSVYHTDYPSDGNPNFGTRWKGNTKGGLNYSLNYLYSYDVNPSVSLSWQSPNTGEDLSVVYLPDTFTGAPTTTIGLQDSAGNFYGVCDPRDPTACSATAGPAQLKFEETVHRIHNVGASFDTAFSTAVPLVLRGEFLYQKDVRVPIVDRTLLGIGDLVNGLKPEKADFFKYVIGADITVATNLLISAQFIQFWNLDYVDNKDCTDPLGNSYSTACGKYTGDPALLHLTNGLQKAREFDNFYSLFLSKPFGEAQRGRLNNIFIYEQKNGGGFWNRLDAEYSFTDELIGTAEWNAYFGEKNTLFGQFDKSSNVQVGLKYIFE